MPPRRPSGPPSRLAPSRVVRRFARSLAPLAVLAALLLPAILVPSPSAEAAGPRGEDIAARVRAMSLEEKVGQVFCVFFRGPDLSPDLAALIDERFLGGVIYYSAAGNIVSPAQTADLSAAIQARAAARPGGIGLFVSIDQEGGPVARLRSGVTLFPSNMAVAATGKPDKAADVAAIMASELRALGVNVNFAPVADVNVNPKNPVIGVRAFGDDPKTVSRFTDRAVKGYLSHGILPTPKHFPGHGDTNVDSHLGLPTVHHDRATLDRVDFPPFRAAIAAGAPAIMTAHVALPAVDPSGAPATLSEAVLEGLLRRDFGFKGLIVTDSLGMAAVRAAHGLSGAAVAALRAGADLLLVGADRDVEPSEIPAAMEAVTRAASRGEILAKRLDEAVARVLAVKKRLGVLDAARIPGPTAKALARVGSPANLAAARNVAAASLTLLRDANRLLPLPASGPTLVVRPRKGAADQDEPALEALAKWPGARVLDVPAEPSEADRQAAFHQAALADAVVVLAPEAGRRPAQAELVRALSAARPGRTVVVLTGAPYDAALFPDLPCLAATYGEVPASLEALGPALFGRAGLPGRCPVKLPGLEGK